MKIYKKLYFLAGIGLGLLLGGIIVGPAINALSGRNIFASKQDQYYNTEKVRYMSYFFRRHHLSMVDVNELQEGIFKGYLYGVGDSGTKYLNKDAYKSYQLSQEGKEIGIGIETNWGINDQYLWATEVRMNTPADKKGVKVGDKIIKVDGIKASGANELLMNERLSPQLGEKHIFTIEDKDTDQIKDIELKAEVLDIDSFTSDILENDIGYIKIKAILKDTGKELEKQLTEFETKNVNKVVLDIRNVNSSQAEWTKEICDIFLDEGICFSVMDNQGKLTEYYTQNGKYEGELVVLIDISTSGTLEAFAAAIQDNNRGKLIGTTTKSQPTIQTLFDLKDGTGVLISTGKLYTSKGIENKGVEADIIAYTSYENIMSMLKNGTISIEEDELIQAGIQYLTEQ